MPVPHLYRQLQARLSQWITPPDQRHLQVFCENVAAILQAQSACLSHWLPYLSHRECQARSHMERLNYFVHTPKSQQKSSTILCCDSFSKHGREAR